MVKVSLLLYHRKRLTKTLDSLEEGIFAPNVKRGGFRESKWINKCILYTKIQVLRRLVFANDFE